MSADSPLSRLSSVNPLPGTCQVPAPGSLADLAGIRGSPEPGTLLRAERTPGAVAVSGVYGNTGERGPTLPGSPPTNSVLRRLYARLYIRQPRPAEGCPHPDAASQEEIVTPYKDSYGKPATPKKPACGKWVVLAKCSSGEHRFAKRLYCWKEWCPVCGENGSAVHKRRQARLLPKVQQLRQLGYLVIEWPEAYRHIGARGLYPDPEDVGGWCYNKKDLRATTNTIVGVLAGKRMGRRGRVDGYFARGVLCWHWHGDKLPGKWNPHENVLVDGGHLEPERLEQIKADLRAALNCPDLIVHYSYCTTPGQMVQTVRYVTRATFRNYDWDPYMAEELWKFRKTRCWGKWDAEPVWELTQAEAEGEDIASLELVSRLKDGKCPDCGLPLKVTGHNHKTGKPVMWSRPVDSTYLLVWGAAQIADTGYYRIPHQEWGGYSLSPETLLRLTEMKRRDRLRVRAALAKRRLRGA